MHDDLILFNCLFFKNGSTPASFFVYFRFFQTSNKIFTTNKCEKMSIQYTTQEFEPTTSCTQVVSHNHFIVYQFKMFYTDNI